MAESDLQEGELENEGGTFRSSLRKGVEGSVGEGLIGVGVITLCIIGLANVIPDILVSVATIAAGIAMAFEGGTLAARYAAVLEHAGTPQAKMVRWGGVTAEFLAGAGGIALGILALLGVAPMVLVPISALIFGGALIIDSGLNAKISALEYKKAEETGANPKVVKETAEASASIQMLVGLGVVTLGILSLIGIDAVTLSLVSILSVGGVVLLTGAMIGGRMAKAIHH